VNRRPLAFSSGAPRAANERGAILVQVGLALVVLLGFVSFAVDYGVLWLARTQAQAAADAGALAAATSLAFDDMGLEGPRIATDSALAIASQTKVWGEPPAVEFVSCTYPFVTGCSTVAGLPLPERRSAFSATIKVYRDAIHANTLPTYLAGLFGVTSQSVRAQATATVAPANVATCVWPLAIPDDWTDQHLANPADALPSLCADPEDLRCKPFAHYRYPAGPPAVTDSPDLYVGPSTDSDDYLPTGYQLLEVEEPMRPTGFDPEIFVDLLGPDPANPGVWKPARRSSLAAVRIGSSGFAASLTSCNPQVLHFGDRLALDTAASWTQAASSAVDLAGRDGATWDPDAFRIRGSCAANGACGATSPRLVLVPMFDPDEYDRTRLGDPLCGGLPCIRIVNFIGMFIDSTTSASQIVGHLTTYPGRTIDPAQPFVGYKWSFLRTAILTR
jgi:hypothetical protein